jgi:hypothetical protein
MQGRPPLVRFETRPVEKRDEAGNRHYVDTDFALITPQGSKDVVEKVVGDWFKQLEISVKDDRFDPRWLEAFEAYYAKWKKGEEVPLNGYPIKNWPSASPAEIRNLIDVGCLTVEDLAAANAEMEGRLGMGARSLVQRAKDFLAAKQDQGPLVARLDAQGAAIARIELENSRLRDENVRLLGALQHQGQGPAAREAPTPQGSLEERLADAQAASPGPDVNKLIGESIDEVLGA